MSVFRKDRGPAERRLAELTAQRDRAKRWDQARAERIAGQMVDPVLWTALAQERAARGKR